MPPTHAIDAQGVPVSSPPKFVTSWSSLTIPQPSTSDTLTDQHRFIFDTMAYPVTNPTSTSSHNQVSRPFQIHSLNCSIQVIISLGHPDG
jgi:hypothetical protein